MGGPIFVLAEPKTLFYNSGLQCNIEKTMVIPVGQITDPNQKLCEDINLEWATEFRILGFNIDNKRERLHSNIESCTRKVRAIINKWGKYNLTLMVRMTVAKALLLSQYTYVYVLRPSD